MRKQLFVLVLALLLLPVGALAEPFYLAEAGVTIEVPEGMSAEDISDDSAYALKMTVDDRDDLGYVYSLGYEPSFEGLWMENLTDEQGEHLISGIGSALADPAYSGVVLDDGTHVLIAASGDGTQLHYVTVLNGWICDVAAASSQALSDDEITLCAHLLSSISFDE